MAPGLILPRVLLKQAVPQVSEEGLVHQTWYQLLLETVVVEAPVEVVVEEVVVA
jgi:hypothetical protein